MTYVLDTSTMAALMRGDSAVITRLERTRANEVFVPEPVWAELAYGIERLPPSRKRELLRSLFNTARSRGFASMPWSAEVSTQFGRVKAQLERRGAPIGDFDVAIAAHAIALDATLVTANVRHFERVDDLDVENWV